MRRITVLIASALINASTIPGLAAESTLNKDVNPAPAVSATVQGKRVNAADNEKTCRAYAASFYESVMLRQASASRVDGARVLAALDSVINAFNDLLATKCGS
jgi:phage gp37-like protein